MMVLPFIHELDGWGWFAVAQLLSDVLALLTLPFILVQRRGRPTGSLAWILAVLAFSWIGLLAWWAFGYNHLKRKRKWRKRAMQKITPRLTELRESLGIRTRLSQPNDPIAAADYGVFPPTDGNVADLLVDGEAAFEHMLASIREAQHHIHFLFYVWNDDEWGRCFRDALAERARAGVEVRAIFDDLGSPRASRRFLRPIREAGGQCEAFLPTRLYLGRWSPNFRNHRKLLVVDGKTAFAGGINIGNEYASAGWRDFMVKMNGPVVDQLQEVFVDDWFFASGHSLAHESYFGQASAIATDHPESALCNVVASGPDTDNHETLDAFFIAINGAREQVTLMTPYFVPDRTILMSLRALRIRGVEVRLLLPGKLDHPIVKWAAESYYHELLRLGVRIFEYQGGMLHGKAMSVDDNLAFIGSANLDQRSFRLNFEASVFVQSTAFSARLKKVFEETQDQSAERTLASTPDATGLLAVKHALAQLASPLL